MPRYRVYGLVVATKYIGEFEAGDKEEAERMAWESEESYISVCHQCASDLGDPEIYRLEVEELKRNEKSKERKGDSSVRKRK